MDEPSPLRDTQVPEPAAERTKHRPAARPRRYLRHVFIALSMMSLLVTGQLHRQAMHRQAESLSRCDRPVEWAPNWIFGFAGFTVGVTVFLTASMCVRAVRGPRDGFLWSGLTLAIISIAIAVDLCLRVLVAEPTPLPTCW